MKLLENKIALVTGGSRGIGKSIVMKFAEQGADVVFTYISSDEKANAVVKACETFNVQVTALKTDASNYNSCEEVISQLIQKHSF